MFTLIVGFIIFFSVLLVLVVLAQNSKGGGLSSQFGGSGASNMFGVKKTGDFLEKSTWGLVIAIMLLALATNFTVQNTEGPSNDILDRAGEQAPVNLNLPNAAEPASDSAAQGQGATPAK